MHLRNVAKLSAGAAKLFASDMSGVKEELAAIRKEAKELCSSEEIKALTLRKQVCTEARALIAEENTQKNHSELVEELRATRDALNQRGGGSTSFTSELQLPCEDSTETPTH